MLFRCRIFFWTTWCQCHTLLNYAWLFMLMQSICIAQLCIHQDLLGGPASSFQAWDWSPLTRPELWLVNTENPPSLLRKFGCYLSFLFMFQHNDHFTQVTIQCFPFEFALCSVICWAGSLNWLWVFYNWVKYQITAHAILLDLLVFIMKWLGRLSNLLFVWKSNHSL